MKWLIIMALSVGIMNIMIAGDQWSASSMETIRLSAIAQELTVIQGEIETAESTIQPLADRLRQQKAELAQLATALAAIETQYPSGSLPSGLAAEYAANRARQDSVATEYDTAFLQYQLLDKAYLSKVSRYNALVEEGAGLAKKHNQLWTFTLKGGTFLP